MLFSRRLPLASLIRLCRDLKHNLAAGIMLRDVFCQQARRAAPAVRPVAERIHQAIESGYDLRHALKQEQAAFPPLFLALAGVGERTGNLPEIFGELEKYYLMQQRFRRQFLRQSFIPVLQFIAATFIIAGLMLILGLIGELTNSKPLDPLGLGLTGARGAVLFLVAVYGTLGVVIVAYALISNSLRQKAVVDRFLLRIPVVGPFLRTLCLARFSLALRLTLDSTMTVASAAGLSFRATGNAAFDAEGERVQDALRAGDDLTVALGRCRLFPEEFLNIVAVAEEGGRVPEVMANQAEYYAEEAERRLAVLTRVAGFGVWLFVATLIVIAIFRIAMIYINTVNAFAG
jgi:type II secretory pathway component PulF